MDAGELKHKNEEQNRVGPPARIKLPNGEYYRLVLLSVVSCKDGKPPAYAEGRIPNAMRFVDDHESIQLEANDWFVLAYVPEIVFGPPKGAAPA